MRLATLLHIIFLIWEAESYRLSSYINVDSLSYNGSSNEIIYKSKILLSSLSTLVFSINGVNYDNYGFSILQAHCFHHNINMSFENSQNETISQYGTNIGFLLKSNETRKDFRLLNNNFDDVNCLIALIAYTKTSPFPGNCDSTDMQMLKLIEEENFLTVLIPSPYESSESCEDSEVTIDTYYTYLDMLNFDADAYFNGIEKMIFNSILTTYKTKHVPLPDRHLLETIPGRGVIINTVVRAKNGEITFYVPVATYSCPQNTWSHHCTDSNFIKRGISVVLVIFSIVMILNLMAPEFIESILNGMLYGGFITILFIKSLNIELQTFDYFITVIIGAFFVSALFGIISLYLGMGRYLTKFTFSLFVVVFIMEIFFDNITSADLQLIIASALSIVLSFLSFTCSVFLGCLLLILNFSYLTKLGNLHRIVMNNYLAITTLPSGNGNETYFDFIRPNYINYKLSLNYVDYGLIVFYIVASIYFTIRKEKFFFGHPALLHPDPIFGEIDEIRNFNCDMARRRREQGIAGIKPPNDAGNFRVMSRCRRHLPFPSNVINERSPLISHLIPQSDDDHYYTPPDLPRSANIRIRISSESEENLENLDSIQTLEM